MRIAIFTFHRAYNCGAMLQAWALQTVLERLGNTVVFPRCNRVGEQERWLQWYNPKSYGLARVRSVLCRLAVNLMSIPATGVSQKRYKIFRKENLKECNFSPDKIAEDYDLLVFGSDQIWRAAHYIDREKDVFFLRGGFGVGVKKMTYAASCDDKPLAPEELEMLKMAVPEFNAVSVREDFLAEQLLKLTGRECPVVLDPTLLLQADDYLHFDCGCAPRGGYLFVYVLLATPFVVATARNVAKRLGVKLILTAVYQYSLIGAPRGMTYGTSPERFVTYIAHAKYVMAQSFHGTVFSLLFHKPFLDLHNSENAFGSRSSALLERIGLGERVVSPINSIEEIVERLMKPVPESAYNQIDALRKQSMDWLKNTLSDLQK